MNDLKIWPGKKDFTDKQNDKEASSWEIKYLYDVSILYYKSQSICIPITLASFHTAIKWIKHSLKFI